VDLQYNAAVWPAHFEELRQRGSLTFESVQRAKDGRQIPVEIVANYVRFGDEESNCAFVRDVTERKRNEEALLASEEKLRALTRRIQAVREEERTNVAREIHDVLAQELTRLKIDLVWLQSRLAKADTAAAAARLAARVAEMSQMADTAIHSVQQIATGLRPAVLDSLGLCAAVDWQARDFQTHAGIRCHVSVPDAELPVGHDAATAAFRVLQESLTNVQRHAHATRVEVSLRLDGGQVILRIEDNGRGFAPDRLHGPLSIGLTGMRERALHLGGQLEIRSQPDAGTRVELRLPATPAANLPT
jgi:signal transduction histidine kinase